jgi:hypothetical protein
MELQKRKENKMARMKDYLMTLDALVVEAYEKGAENEIDIWAYVTNRVPASFADVRETCKNLFLFIEDYKNGR